MFYAMVGREFVWWKCWEILVVLTFFLANRLSGYLLFYLISADTYLFNISKHIKDFYSMKAGCRQLYKHSMQYTFLCYIS